MLNLAEDITSDTKKILEKSSHSETLEQETLNFKQKH